MFQLKQENVVMPYEELNVDELDDYELIKSLKTQSDERHSRGIATIEERMNYFASQFPNNFGMNNFGGSVYGALAIKIGNNINGYIKTFNIVRDLRKNLESYLDRDLSDYYYLEHYDDFIDINKLPIVTFVNKEKKIVQLYVELLNQLFEPFKKNVIGNTFYVQIPKRFIDNYEYFVNNKLFLQRFKANEELYHMINSYFRNVLYQKSHNFTLSKTFENSGLPGQVNYDESNGILSINMNVTPSDYIYNNKVIDQYHYDLWLFSTKMIGLLTTIEMIGILREYSLELDINEHKTIFLNNIKNRRISIDAITHKGVLKEAKSLGITHLFLPLDEEAIPAGLPFSLKVELKAHDKIANIWNITPPIEGLSVIRKYIGHNKDYPEYTTLSEPHLVGFDLMKVKFDDDFYQYLIDGYDWEHKQEAIQTIELIAKYPRLKSDLEKIAKERSVND